MTSRLPSIARTAASLSRALDRFQAEGARVALVPTMGALHDGHLSLVRLAQKKADRVIVSIFVNPTQFAPHEDFSTYPRSFDDDRRKLANAKTDLIWAPDMGAMYPQGFATRIVPEGAATVGLEDRFRPHFFSGVATVVGKLFAQCRPDFAIFGEKDYQQLLVVRQLSIDLDLGVQVIGAPIVRERDGLAMSSRNLYMSKDERAVAPVIHRTLRECAARLRDGGRPSAVLARGTRTLTDAGFHIDYLELRDAKTLEPIRSVKTSPGRLLVAAKLGTTRLIDNIKV